MKNGDPKGLVDGGKMATVILDWSVSILSLSLPLTRIIHGNSIGQSPWLIDLAWYFPVGKSMVQLREVAASMMRNRVEVDADTTMRDLTSYLVRMFRQSFTRH